MEKSRPRLLIDGRMADAAGIGTYIRNVVPKVLAQLPHVSVRCLLTPEIRGGRDWLGREDVEVIIDRTPPLSINEQWRLRQLLHTDEVFWATSLAHPLKRRGGLVATVHDVMQLALPSDEVGGRFVQWACGHYLRSLCCHAGALLFDSEFTAREFRRLVGVPRQAVAVAALGVSEEWFESKAPGSPCNRPYFITVGSIRPHKNLGGLLTAFERIQQDIPHDLIFVGSAGGMRTRDSNFARQLTRLGARVQFLGRIEDHALRRWIGHADALIFPSLYEGFGLPALEAMALGCPVLAARAGALPEVCGMAAQYFDPRSTEQIAGVMKGHVRLGLDEREQWVHLGRERAAALRWGVTAQVTAQVIGNYLADRRYER